MWQKIKTIEDVYRLKVGEILAKYPIDGRPPEEEINTDDFFQFEIYSLGSNVELKVHDNEINELSNLLGGLTVTGTGGHPPILNKTQSELIDEGIWWIQ